MGDHEMSEDRPLKKSESLEIRIPYPTKQAFMARCRADGLSASEALRAHIERTLAPPAAPPAPRRWIAGVLIAAAVGAMAAPALAQASILTGFDRLDSNHDGRISPAEFRGLDANGDGAVSRDEFRR